ncbi:MAG: helix-turn-helix transcriptional regulator [Methyloligellaceae bacterium]
MVRASTTDRLQRLELLKSRVKSGDPVTIGDLADELGVSVRTVNRDIEVLRDQGVPIDADRGRGGGIRLDRSWGIGRVNFNYTEAVDLLITLAIAEQMESPLFMANLKGIRRKLVSSFAPAMKSRVNDLKARILIGPSASTDVLSGFFSPAREITELLHQAFLMRQCIAIKYKAKDGSITDRVIQPHFLFLSFPVWYVLAWDELRSDVRTFRCDRIISIHIREEEFNLLPFSAVERVIEGTKTI